MYDGGDVHLHHIEQSLQVDLAKLAVGAESSVVDEDIYRQTLLFDKTKDPARGLRACKIGSKDLGLNFVAGSKFVSESFQPIGATSGQD
jgi:hypothetical protein